MNGWKNKAKNDIKWLIDTKRYNEREFVESYIVYVLNGHGTEEED